MRSWVKAISTLFVVASLLLMTLPVAAQMNSAVRGSMGGVVFDATGSVLPDADVALTGPQGEYKVKTDSMGRYMVQELVPGSYTVKVEAKGFKTYVSQRNLVVAGETSSLDVHLQVGAVSDTITVEAGAVQIDTESTALTTPLTDQLYQSLPLARNVSGIFALAAGVVSGGGTDTKNNGTNPSIGGASGLENLYLVDGVNVTDQAFGGFGTYNRYWDALGTGVNLAFIKEVDIKTTAFEPQYGKAAGGIVEIVTKSGSNAFHGAVAAYMGPGAWWAARNQTCTLGYTTTVPACHYTSPQYDISGEFGGYVPGFKNKMFFFGAFDPAVAEDYWNAGPGEPLSKAQFNETLNERSWAGKLTFTPWANTQIEASSFGDPSFSDSLVAGPENYNLVNFASGAGRYNFGNINSVLRVDQTISPTWVVNLSYTYNMAHFRYSPNFNNYTIQDRSVSPYITYYVGGYEPSHDDDYSLNLSTQKIVNALGQHTLSVGYTYEHTNFLDLYNTRTGPLFAIPANNAAGAPINVGSHSAAVGKMTNATFRLYPATSACTYCAKTSAGTYAYLQTIRGTYSAPLVLARSRYHVGWANDSWQMGRHINIGAGLRWEEQWYSGEVMNYLFNDNWSPRLGINWDPKGDRRTKLFFNYARYQSVLPLDAAIRQLGNEQDDTTYYFVPDHDAAGNIKYDSNGAPVVIPDSAHALNGTAKSATASFGNPSFASSTGEGILPGTRMEYENEYVFGLERELTPGSMLGVRYSDRRLGRVVEDIGSQSPEGSLIDNFYNGGIANVAASTDISVNENEAVYTPAQWTAANGANTPGNVTAATYKAPVTGCTFADDTSVANGDFFRNYSGAPYNGACITNLSTAAGGNPDGKPDGFANPIRKYQEFVVEYARNMKDNWQARGNFRYARLFGNYEGFFRNDNGQSDPGISSLFDFTNGAISLLGDQTTPGLLNTDRRMVANVDVSYMVNDKTPAFHGVKGLNVGVNFRGMSGTPLSAYMSHPIYLNTGEVPVGGRGTKGTLPSRRQVDLHADYPVKIHESMSIKLAFDAFNITDSKFVANRNQNLDTSPGVSNPDYNRVNQFQAPFYARASVKFEF
ncbi:Outer membrane receptor protein [Candidatus Sulfotelmatomonas gaucii]|uniref:Outer membrane receptor protein n=1 Tax=Candidatus Sulfuritelmatomonas gaucii TaxID=2043161 RepID=A0A2N9L325_9BACT|nr:Outer membrane receptor protein [Candidatus Sulfotelmatomonas gaucii]